MRTKTLIHAAKLALVFLLVGCSSSGDGSSGATAELGSIGGGHWAGPATAQAGLGGAPTRDGAGQDLGVGGVGGATPSESHPGAAGSPTGGKEPGGAAGAGCASAHETGAGGKSGGACSFFGGIFRCPGSSSAPGTKTEGGSGGHRGATPAEPGSTGGAGPGGAGTVIPRLL